MPPEPDIRLRLDKRAAYDPNRTYEPTPVILYRDRRKRKMNVEAKYI